MGEKELEGSKNSLLGKVKKLQKKDILLIILLVLILLAIIFYFVFDNTNEVNEYTGDIDLSYVEQTISDNEYYLFEDNGQKYILFKMTAEAYTDLVKIESASIYNKSYNDNNQLELNINLNTDKYRDSSGNAVVLYARHTDSMFFIQKVEDNCTGLIVNDTEYTKYSGGIIQDEETQKYGYLDSNGNIVIPIEYTKIAEMDDTYYDEISEEEVSVDYSNYLIIYDEENGYGIASKEGKILIDCQYQSIINFEAYSFAVTRGDMSNAEIGIVDIYGNTVVQFVSGGIFDNSDSFDKYAVISLNNKKGVINRNLEILIPIEYDEIAIGVKEESTGNTIYFAAEKDGEYQILNEDGKDTISESLYSITQMFGTDIGEEEIEEVYNSILDSGLINY